MSKETSATDSGNAWGGRSPSYTALKLAQNGHNIYFTTIPIDELFDYCVVERRSEDPTEGFQRRLSESRADEIAEYLNTEANSIPINIVLSAQPDAEFTYIRENKAVSFKRVVGAFIILDGQHRMWGYQKCSARHRVPVAIYEGLARPDEDRLFVDINTKHQGVPKRSTGRQLATDEKALLQLHLRAIRRSCKKDEERARQRHARQLAADYRPYL